MSHRRTAESGSTALVSRGAFAIPEPALVVDRYHGRGANITAQSKQRYTRRREVVEAKLWRWFGVHSSQ